MMTSVCECFVSIIIIYHSYTSEELHGGFDLFYYNPRSTSDSCKNKKSHSKVMFVPITYIDIMSGPLLQGNVFREKQRGLYVS